MQVYFVFHIVHLYYETLFMWQDVVVDGKMHCFSLPGQARVPKGRCFCADKGVNMVPPKLIEKVEIIPPSPSCKTQEIV